MSRWYIEKNPTPPQFVAFSAETVNDKPYGGQTILPTRRIHQIDAKDGKYVLYVKVTDTIVSVTLTHDEYSSLVRQLGFNIENKEN